MKTLLALLLLSLTALGSACAGPKGDTGFHGNTGAVGPASAPCTTSAVPGGVSITCPDGTRQTVYNGSDATSITPVKVCANVTTVYPSSFAEYLFCLNNQLYGVYWSGTQAFWSLVPPGAYSSTSPNGCNFTVGPSCQITN